MFNMYDDQGIKTQVVDPYRVKKLTPSFPTQNRVADERKQNFNKQNFHENISSEAKNAYKKMANIHVEEDIYHVYQLMSSHVITIQENETIYNCWLKMEEHNLKQIPVLGFDNKLKGLATMKDITKILIEHSRDSDYIYNTSIKTIMKYDIMTAEPISDIRRVAKVMVKYHLSCIPIVESGSEKVVGIISRSDILRAVSSDQHFQLWA